MAKSRRGRPRVGDRGAIAIPSQRTERPMFLGGPDPITMNKLEGLVANLRTLQQERFSRTSQADPRRDLEDECGYPKVEWNAQQYHDLIAYEPMAAIVNAIFPIESWQLPPRLYEQEDAETATEWEDAWDELPSMLGVEPSHFKEEEGSVIWSALQTADILAGEGRYSVILIGLKDGKQLSEPASPRKNQELTFISCFPEYLATVSSFEMDPGNPRYRQPLYYNITFSDPNEMGEGGLNEPGNTEIVHWSRIIHVADRWHTACSSKLFAIPRCKPVRNPILDIRKVRGSSAEMYYKGAFGGHHFGTHPQLGADVDVDVGAAQDMYEEYINGLQRAIFTSGMSVDPLAPQVVDPTPQILVHIEAIAMKMRCPKRKLIGNETGERATEDDAKSWSGVLQSRNKLHTTPTIVTQFVNRLINLGVLPKPADDGIICRWPDIYSMSDIEKSQVLLTRTQAYVAYGQGMEAIVPPLDYMTKFDDMEEEEAQAIIDAAEAAQEQQMEDDAALADEHGMIPEIDGFQHPPTDPIELAKETAKAKASVATNQESLSFNRFCATGKGGGIDPTCTSGGHSRAKRAAAHVAATGRQPDSVLLHTTPAGDYSEKRKKLHEKIVNKAFEGATPVEKPVAYFMGGGTSAGKSTMIDGLSLPKNAVTLNPDLVKEKLPEYNKLIAAKDMNAGNFVHRESSHVTDQIQDKATAGKYHTLVDGTGDSGIESLAPYINDMRAKGAKIVANYITIDTQTAVDRAFKRGQETGRFVPEAAIRATHRNVSKIVPEAIKRGLYDEFTLWDNTGVGKGEKPHKVAEAKGTELVVHDKVKWDRFVAKGTE